jgi:hypothetical protein
LAFAAFAALVVFGARVFLGDSAAAPFFDFAAGVAFTFFAAGFDLFLVAAIA